MCQICQEIAIEPAEDWLKCQFTGKFKAGEEKRRKSLSTDQLPAHTSTFSLPISIARLSPPFPVCVSQNATGPRTRASVSLGFLAPKIGTFWLEETGGLGKRWGCPEPAGGILSPLRLGKEAGTQAAADAKPSVTPPLGESWLLWPSGKRLFDSFHPPPFLKDGGPLPQSRNEMFQGYFFLFNRSFSFTLSVFASFDRLRVCSFW